MATDPLLEPFQLKHLTLRNRVFSSSHEPAYSEDGMPKDRYRLYHEEKAKGGIALTMTAGSAVVSRDSPPSFGNLLAYKDEIVPWIQRLTDGVHEHGSACMIQISHLGRRTTWNQADWLPVVAPSALREPAHRSIPKEAEDWDIERIVDDYGSAAARMEAGGMDGIEIESYGHLFDAWWSPQMNFRDDEWAVSEQDRFRFATQVLQAIRSATSEDFLVGLRLAVDQSVPDGIDEPAGLAILDHFEQAHLIDFVNVIRGSVETDVLLADVIPIHGMASAPHLEFVGRVRDATELPVLHASKIDDVASARYAIESGKVDLVGMTRAHMADPHLIAKIKLGQVDQIRQCVGANYCIDRQYQGLDVLCIQNAATSRESTMPHIIEPTNGVKRKVVVVGGGPAGMEAARVCAERGHEVVLFEKAPELGGQITLASKAPQRDQIAGITRWFSLELARLKVDMRLNTAADMPAMMAENPDVVILAVGGTPFIEQNPEWGAAEGLVVSSWDILSGKVEPGKNVLVYDTICEFSGMSAADYLAAKGSLVEMVTDDIKPGAAIGGTTFPTYYRSLYEREVIMTSDLALHQVYREGDKLVAVLENEYTGQKEERVVDQIVVENGVRSDERLYYELKADSVNKGQIDLEALYAAQPQPSLSHDGQGYLLFRLGDCVSQRNTYAAIYDALRLCKDF